MADQPGRETAKERRRRQLVSFSGHLLAYPTVQAAAEASGICPRTATRWLHSREFRRVYVESREATLQNLAGMLRQSSVGAVEALAAVIRDPDAPATAKTNAAKSILDTMLRLIETKELEARVKRLEEKLVEAEQ